MDTILVVFASSEGQTAKVADHIAGVLREAGASVALYGIDDLPADLAIADYDGVLIGASIHMGKHQQSIRRFVRDHAAALGAVPSGFFQVCLSSASEAAERQREAATYVEELVAATGWEPDTVGLFGGALKFSEYGFIKGKLMKAIAADFGETDASRDHEYTDWDEVTAFAEAFQDSLAGASARA